ncbi:MAG: UDP-N-acetylmuramoyl-L-alanyl-D-glutamate--2,6-diaminopimelate ligase [Candidatus Cloacimonadaceae bacterium]
MWSISEYLEMLKADDLWLQNQNLDIALSFSGKPVTDSRQLQKGDIFICIKGYQTDGHNFIAQAIERGASLIIQEDEFSHNFPAVRVKNSRKAAALLAKMYYSNPSGKFTLIGITGTNGKTTTSLLIRQALEQLGYKTGWIGTLGYQINSDMVLTNNTTPDILELNSIFTLMVEAECRYVVMEVSSHALALDRVYGVEFDLAIFTNLSREHLDFHGDMEQYFESKYLLFSYLIKNHGIALINIDDPYGVIINERLIAQNYTLKYTISEKQGDYILSAYKGTKDGSQFTIINPRRQKETYKTNLIGHFNVLNSALALIAVKTILPDTEYSVLQKIAAALTPVKGRLEQVPNDQEIGIFVDYAHTPDALKNVLEALCELPHRRIITVFGAGGDRDKGKRPEMLKIVLNYSDAVIITDDNPRTEAPKQIIRDIIERNELWQPWWIIRNRKAAIEAAINLAKKGDLVLIAGKGHETYQEIKGIRYHFDDAETVKQALETNEINSGNELALPIDSLLLEILYKSEFFNSDETDRLYKHISTDSRTVGSESLYFALKGEKYDGMDYLDAVLKDPTNAAVIRFPSKNKINTIAYPDPQTAMGLLARKYLLMFSVCKIALTGSTGKTTTKEYLANIFSLRGSTLKTQENENNIIGLCKTIFRIKPQDETAILELGTNHPGEIAPMANICNPDIAIITNIGPSHLEFFRTEEAVYKEKAELFRHGAKLIFFPGDDSRFEEFREKGKSVGFSENCDYRISKIKKEGDSIKFNLNSSSWTLPQKIPYFVSNAAFAVACAMEQGIKEDIIQEGLSKKLALPQRMEIIETPSGVIIADCYNANPVSMKAAIDFWKEFQNEKNHIAILGDMLELGEQAAVYHQVIGSKLTSVNCALLITVGSLAEYYAKGFSKSASDTSFRHEHYKSADDLIHSGRLDSLPLQSVILIKGSHAIRLESVVDYLTDKFNPKYHQTGK